MVMGVRFYLEIHDPIQVDYLFLYENGNVLDGVRLES